jgi:acetyl esterase
MPLAPAARNLFDVMEAAGTRPLWELSLEEARSKRDLFGIPDEPVSIARVEDRTIPGPGGDLPVRIYTPDASEPRPLIAYFHGGGFVFCSLDTHDNTCRRLANATGAVVVSVDYRLGPEHRFPAALDDCYAATAWVHNHANELGADAARLVVGGDSAGGNLAAGTTLMARDAGGPPIRFQLLVYPVIDASCNTASYAENGEGYFLTAQAMRWFWEQYLGADGDPNAPFASPIRAELSGLPRAYVVTAEYDPLRDEGEAYADSLRAAGVDAKATRYDGMIHGFWSKPTFFPEADQAMAEIAVALNGALAAAT